MGIPLRNFIKLKQIDLIGIEKPAKEDPNKGG